MKTTKIIYGLVFLIQILKNFQKNDPTAAFHLEDIRHVEIRNGKYIFSDKDDIVIIDEANGLVINTFSVLDPKILLFVIEISLNIMI